VPATPAARLLYDKGSVRASGDFRHGAGDQPDVRRDARRSGFGEAWTAAGRPADARLSSWPGRGVLMSDCCARGWRRDFRRDLRRSRRNQPGSARSASADVGAGARTINGARPLAKFPRAAVSSSPMSFFDALPARHFVRTSMGRLQAVRPSDASDSPPRTGLFPDGHGRMARASGRNDRRGKLAFGLAAYVESGLPLEAQRGRSSRSMSSPNA